MERFEKQGVPADILAAIAKPPLLNGESRDEYFALLAGIFDDFGARDRPEYLWAISYGDWQWEIIRLKRMRALVVDHWRERGRTALVKDRLPATFSNFEEQLAQLYPEGVNRDLVGARGLIMATDNGQLAYFDKAIERLQRRCDSILQLIEARREVLLHRERERLTGARKRDQLRLATNRDSAEEAA